MKVSYLAILCLLGYISKIDAIDLAKMKAKEISGFKMTHA